LQIRNLCNGKNLAGAGDVNIYLGPCQIEARGVGVKERTDQEDGCEGTEEA
jgi:hypothetical protein